MVTSAIFAPNPVSIMDYLYSSNLPLANDNLSRPIPTTAPIGNNNNTNNRPRLICVHSAPSPIETSSSIHTNGSIYVMVTADSKGQLKLLVNRFHR
jgi:hypothetical protein